MENRVDDDGGGGGGALEWGEAGAGEGGVRLEQRERNGRRGVAVRERMGGGEEKLSFPNSSLIF